VIPPFRYYLFDIDGTLLDSAPDICGAISQVLEDTAQPDVAFDRLRGYIGRHLLDTFGDLLPGAPPAQIEEMIARYRQFYLARNHAQTSVYPGVEEGLRALGGFKATATTKGTPTTRAVLEKFGLLPYFHHIQGTDGFPSKPAPDVIFRALEGLAGDPAETLMVGDSASDMEAGRRAGIRICAVTYGYGKREDLARFAPDYWVDDLRELSGG
jgi:phosphoglycolate phosphatase